MAKVTHNCDNINCNYNDTKGLCCLFNPDNCKYRQLQKENAELKCECRRCVYSDTPCILSDYGKDRNEICDHFKDVFDENAELKEKNLSYKDAVNMQMYTNRANKEIADKQLTKAKEIIKTFLGFAEAFGYSPSMDKFISDTEQFISEVEK